MRAESPSQDVAVPAARQAALAAYVERRAAAESEAKRLDNVSAWFANGRLLTFVAAVAFAGFSLFNRLPGWGWWAALASFAAYVLLAWRHARVLKDEERAKARAALNERGIARLRGQWHTFPEKGERFLAPDHLYAADLDVFGQGSLFQLIDETATKAGEATLAGWLAVKASAAVVRERQVAVKELAPLIEFRQALLVESRIVAREKVDPARFVAWCEGGPYLRSIRWARPLAFLIPAATLTLFVLGRFELVPSGWWWFGVMAAIAVVGATRNVIRAFYEQIVLGERGFVQFGDTFAVVEKQAFSSPLLARLVAPLRPAASGAGPRASERLARFSRAFGFAEARQSSQLAAVLNVLTLWDVHTMFALEKWREQNGKLVRPWFDALAQLEALGSLAGFAHDRPDFTFPEIDEGAIRYVARELGHPLLEQPVRNDVALDGPKTALVVTGSNMSGKTTMLRSIGINAVLALAGAPVCAASLSLGELRTVTSMRVKDSLERGVSYFYAEVQRIRAVLEAARAENGKVLFLLDEILLGTNTRERQIASRELLRLLLETGAIGAVTTHDLALTSLAEAPWAHVRNVHFRDLLVDGKMAFDYRMRDGVVETTNALRVLAEAGVPISESA